MATKQTAASAIAEFCIACFGEDPSMCKKCTCSLWNFRVKQKPVSLAEKPEDVTDTVWQDFKASRKVKGALVTSTVIRMFRSEALKAGISLQEAIEFSILMGWRGFKSDWYRNEKTSSPKKAAFGNYGSSGAL